MLAVQWHLKWDSAGTYVSLEGTSKQDPTIVDCTVARRYGPQMLGEKGWVKHMEDRQKLEQSHLRVWKDMGKQLQESDVVFGKENAASNEDWEEVLKIAENRKAASEEQDLPDHEMHRTMD